MLSVSGLQDLLNAGDLTSNQLQTWASDIDVIQLASECQM